MGTGCRHLQRLRHGGAKDFLQQHVEGGFTEGICRWFVQSGVGVRAMWALARTSPAAGVGCAG